MIFLIGTEPIDSSRPHKTYALALPLGLLYSGVFIEAIYI